MTDQESQDLFEWLCTHLHIRVDRNKDEVQCSLYLTDPVSGGMVLMSQDESFYQTPYDSWSEPTVEENEE